MMTTHHVRDARPATRDSARLLRQEQTRAEDHLWQALRDRQLGGLKFRRQHAVGPYILDFYCPAHRLVIELDGSGHDEAEQFAYDIARTEQLAAYDYRVLRFRNDAVFDDLEGVLTRILAETGPHPAPAAPPSPNAGRGCEREVSAPDVGEADERRNPSPSIGRGVAAQRPG